MLPCIAVGLLEKSPKRKQALPKREIQGQATKDLSWPEQNLSDGSSCPIRLR